MPDKLETLVKELLASTEELHIKGVAAQIYRQGVSDGWDKHVAVANQRERDQDEAKGVTRLVNGEMRKVVWSERRDAGEAYDAEAGIWLDEKGYTAYVRDGWGSGVSGPAKETKDEARTDSVRLWSRMYGDLSKR
jgi:hypothetical protein